MTNQFNQSHGHSVWWHICTCSLSDTCSAETLHHPHASASALTPFPHTSVAFKGSVLPLGQCLSQSSSSLVRGGELWGWWGGGGGVVSPVSPPWDRNTEPSFMGWTGGTHISLSALCISSLPWVLYELGGMLECWVVDGLEPSFYSECTLGGVGESPRRWNLI